MTTSAEQRWRTLGVDSSLKDAPAGRSIRAPEPPVSSAAVRGGDIEVRAPIAEGGIGVVMLARQHSLGRDVAVKRVRKSLVAAGLDGAALIARGPQGGGTRFAVATGAAVTIE